MLDVEEQTADSSTADAAGSAVTAMLVVGIGVCARSLRSLETLFAGIGPELGAAYLIAVRQQEGLDVATVVDVLTRQSPLPVSIGKDGERIKPNHIYVGGSDDMITIEDGHLGIRPADEPVGHRGTIDSMLISLAEHAHERAVAVILDGLGSDGTAGVTATKKYGGLSIGETGSQNDENGAQGAVGPFGAVDLHLPVEQIGAQITKYLRNLAAVADTPAQEALPEQVEAQVTPDHHHPAQRHQQRLPWLQAGHVPPARPPPDAGAADRRRRRLCRAAARRSAGGAGPVPGPADRRHAVFSRSPGIRGAGTRTAAFIRGKGTDDQFRVWVLGCATGEEAYSIAILLRERMATLDHPPQVQIFATDLDPRALGLARTGRYAAAAITNHVRPDRLDRWFVREGDTYCVSKELREMCIFSPHNLIKDAPFSRVDVLSCRNLLIYLNVELQNRVIPIFHFSLRPGGVLFLGNSENVTRPQKLFAPVDRKNRVFRRLETATRTIPDFPLSTRPRVAEPSGAVHAETPSAVRLSGVIGRQAEVIAERYAPAYVVVDPQGDVLHFSGRTGRFLEPVAGVASLNVINLVHRDLRIDLRAAMNRAISEQCRVELPRLVLRRDDRATSLNLIVEPIGTGDVRSLTVLFQDLGLVSEGSERGDQLENGEHVERLETELRLTRDRLQATIEELESTNEELKSSNEEYQSINEELQSANEEMETSKEELQSVNEELQTVNGELAHRVSELGRSNSDLKNLLEATQIATLFLDNDLRVRSFTPSATEIFHLLETDVGRPLDHVVSRVAYPQLQEDVRQVLKTLVPIDGLVEDSATGCHYAVRVLPYRSVDNYISGAVVTFTDLTAVHKAETALRDSEERMRALLSASSQSLYRMSPDWSEMIDMAGTSFLAGTQKSTEWLEQHIPADEQPRVRAAIDAARREKRVFELEHRVRRPDGSIGWAMSRAVPITDASGEIVEWFGAASDITERLEAQEATRESEERLHSLVEGLTQLTWRAVDTGRWTWASQQWSEFTGQAEPDSHDWGWIEPLHPDDREIARAAWSRAAEQGGFEVEYRIRRASDGGYRWFQIRAKPVRDAGGAIVEWIGTSTDINDLRGLQEHQAVLVAELQHRTRNLLGVVRQTAHKTVRASSDLQDFWARYRDRLDALARVQGLLSRLREQDRVTFDDLLRSELAAHGSEPGQDSRVLIEGPAGIRIRSTTVQTLAIAIHELATNAVKYGALGQPEARLAVRWQVRDEAGSEQPWLHIDWRESGVAMPSREAVPQGGGQGRELIERALPYQLAARTTYVLDDDGVHCTIAMPVSASSVSSERLND